MTGGLRDIETTITKYLVAVHYFLLTLAGIRRLLIFLLLGKKSVGRLFLEPIINAFTTSDPPLSADYVRRPLDREIRSFFRQLSNDEDAMLVV